MSRIAEHDDALVRIRGLMREEASSYCADCSKPDPRHLNLTFGTLVCDTCSELHRDAKRRVKSIDTATFMYEDADVLEAVGNAKANSHWLANWNPREFPEPKPGDRSAISEFLWLKYDGSWTRPGSRNPADPSMLGPAAAGGSAGAYGTVRGRDPYGTVRGGAPPGYDPYMSYRSVAPPPVDRHHHHSSSSSRRKKKSSRSKKSSSHRKSKNDSDDDDESDEDSFDEVEHAKDDVAGQLKLMFGEVSVIQTPMGWRVMTPTGMMLPQMAFQMGFAKMNQQQAIFVLQRQAMVKKQQAKQAEIALQQQAIMKQQQAAQLKQQAKMIKKGGSAALNMVRMQQQVQQMQQAQQMQQMNQMRNQMAGGAGFSYQAAQIGYHGTPQQRMQMQYGGQQKQQYYPQGQMGAAHTGVVQSPITPQPAQLALPAPQQSNGSFNGGAQTGSDPHYGSFSAAPAAPESDLLGGMAGGLNPHDLLGNGNQATMIGDYGAPAQESTGDPIILGGAPPSQDYGGFDDNPFAEFGGAVSAAPSAAPATEDNPFF